MWRRACLRDRDASWSVTCVWAAVVTSLLLIVAGYAGWAAGLVVGAVVAVLSRWRFEAIRRRWDRLVAEQGREAVAAAELILRQRGRGPSA